MYVPLSLIPVYSTKKKKKLENLRATHVKFNYCKTISFPVRSSLQFFLKNSFEIFFLTRITAQYYLEKLTFIQAAYFEK